MAQIILHVTRGDNLHKPEASSFSNPFQTNEEHILNGSVGNNQADHYSALSETQLVNTRQRLSGSSDPRCSCCAAL